MTDDQTTNTNEASSTTAPPKAVKQKARSLSADRIRKFVERHEYFPPRFIAYYNPPAPERTARVLWVLRYRVADSEVTGLANFVPRTDKPQRACRWTEWETDTSYQQIVQEIDDIYQAADGESSQAQFCRDINKFADHFQQKMDHC